MTRTFDEQVAALEKDWAENPRWKGVTRDYTAADVVRLRGSVTPEYTMARNGAEKLWQQINDMDYVHALGTMTGGQAIQYAKAGLPAIYLSGWQVAGGDVDVVALYFELVGPVAQNAIELGGRDVDDGGLTYASAVEPIACFAALVDGDLADHRGGSSRVEFVGDDARHATDGVGATAVTCGDEEFGERPDERGRGAERVTIGKDHLGISSKRLDHREEVVPVAGVERSDVIPQGEEDLVHGERSADGLDEHAHADRACGEAELGFGPLEHVVPEQSVGGTFELG